MRRLFAVGGALLLCATIARAGDLGSGSHRAETNGNSGSRGEQRGSGLTVGPDPFRSGDQVVRDRDTGRPLYRVEPDPFHSGSERIEDYNTGRPVGEIRPDPFNPDQSVIDDQ
jgi:hypothetical protein